MENLTPCERRTFPPGLPLSFPGVFAAEEDARHPAHGHEAPNCRIDLTEEKPVWKI
ncbi:MAG: hypothetical protein LBD68_07280 [Zoogloeaceae bacterium]|jgi:hypothetical protein|nr:hypothetical protein [Zoogloeaceae bacterium]